MGYRTYIAQISKKEHEKIKSFTIEQLSEYKNEKYVGVYDIPEKKLYELGKYTEFDDNKYYTKFFDNEKTNDYYLNEHDFWIVNKDYLKHIINFYKEKIKETYKSLSLPFGDIFSRSQFMESGDYSKMTDEEYNAIPLIIDYIRSNNSEWNYMEPFKLDEGEEITTSWKYEYAIFELVRIYKTFDWENNLMIYYGY